MHSNFFQWIILKLEYPRKSGNRFFLKRTLYKRLVILLFFLTQSIQTTEKEKKDKERINIIREREPNIDKCWSWMNRLPNVDWQMLVYVQVHVKEMDSKHHPEEFFTF